MPKYLYKAREENGRLIHGEMAAASADELARKLRNAGCMPTHITPVADNESADDGRRGGSLFDLDRYRPVSAVQMIMFTVRLSNMIDAGIPLLRCLDISVRQTANPRLAKALEGVRRAVSGGSSFSDALACLPGIFSALFISIIKSGEVSGNLKLVLHRYAVYLENQEDIRQKIKNATFYPMILLCAAAIIFSVMIIFIIPKFIAIFTESGVPLPLPTQLLYQLGTAINKYWYLFGIILIGVIMFLKGYVRTGVGRAHVSRIQLRLPVVGDLANKIMLARFCRSLATLLQSGVSMLESLTITHDATGNTVMAAMIRDARRSIEKGEMLATAFARHKGIPEDVRHMIAVGEETGKLGAMLDKIADFYDAGIDHAIKRLLLLIEPVLIVIMGGVTGLIMASMILPLFDMVKTIQR
ncbi:MAG: type II secretion system F family protein [Candidatus Omnitrophica bacterium]|nr:type II secretion system F family protein [Candidatus Omnitrophota bacterium]